ncbi:hypothetical protein [Dyella tabacisoli]|uniref:Uncharacterized protein n=1 Tax=Dyella tabacisoli TaxID=2282381 RepID=A0A369UN47_9GAMM|nr:hypothetical protein [Dyella tabacisoli]RDD81495.1 hypothetical protein DVJ77_09940 [Dyella tabacisoli]
MLLDVEPPEPHKTGHHKIDLIIGGSALFLSLVSLAIAVLHGHTMERMANANTQLVQANSWPFLQVTTSNEDDNGERLIALTVKNAGVGPAKIYSSELRYKGEIIQKWQKFLDDCCSVPGTSKLSYSSSDNASFGVVRAGEAVNILRVAGSDENRLAWNKLNVARDGVSFKICYCSVFDECWTTNGKTLSPTPVKTCEAKEEMGPQG